MITRPHVCLKCQLQLARRAPSRTQAAYKSTWQRHHQEKDEEQDGPIKRPYVRPSQLQQTDISRRPLLSQYPMGKLYGHGGKKLREEREHLDFQALGENAEVIVLRDSRFTTYNRANKTKPDQEPKPIDILATLESERGLVGNKEVDENINQFRPKEGEEPQDWDTFNSLVQDLQAGFTATQLQRYIKAFSKANTERPSATPLIPWVSPWVPATSQDTQNADGDYARGYSVASYTNKQKLALRLIRECWELELPELVAGIGEVELELNPKDYDLLLRGSRPILGLIATEHIGGDDERIDGFRSRHAIRITTTRLKSELIIKEIEKTLKNIRREKIYMGDLMAPGYSWAQLRQWAEAQFNGAIIKDLSRMTNTEIEHLRKRTYMISCIDQNPESVRGNKIDIVIRLIVATAGASSRVTSWLGCKETAGASSGTFVEYTTTDGLGWRDRFRQWTRWTAPITKKPDDEGGSERLDAFPEEPTDNKAPRISPDETPEGARLALGMTDSTTQLNRESGAPSAVELEGHIQWEETYRTESSALLGSILHSSPDIKRSVQARQPTDKTIDGYHRAFSTAVPNLSLILSSIPILNQKPSRTLIMRFKPNPFFKLPETSTAIGGAALTAFPEVEIRFATIDRETHAFQVRDIQAVIGVSNSDLMLPESASDIRFQQRTVSRLVTPSGQYPPGIAEFLRLANLDVDQGLFDAPPKLTIPIAAHLCQGPGLALLGGGAAGSRDVEYLFTGLEVRKALIMEYDGWRLHYTSIEAGRAAGRRGELRLLPVRWAETRSATEEEFQGAALRLAGAVDEAAPGARVLRTVHAPLGIRKVESRPKDEPPRYFNKTVDIRQSAEQLQELSERLAEADKLGYLFQDGDDDEFA